MLIIEKWEEAVQTLTEAVQTLTFGKLLAWRPSPPFR
jgi:hypothetical protein